MSRSPAMTAAAVAKLTDAISELQQEIGIEDTRKLLFGLAEGLGAPEEEIGPAGGGAPTEPGPTPCGERPADASASTLHGKERPARRKVGRVRALKANASP